MELSVGNCPTFSVFTLPEICRFILTPGFHMLVHSILRCVQQSSDKPLGKRRVPFHCFTCPVLRLDDWRPGTCEPPPPPPSQVNSRHLVPIHYYSTVTTPELAF